MSEKKLSDMAAFKLAREKLGKTAVAIRKPGHNVFHFKLGKSLGGFDVKWLSDSTKGWEDAFRRAGVNIPKCAYHPRYPFGNPIISK
ncbi:hypothetical protein [Rubellicoccus peritrichatus]|uniref:Uncharacterized protein n=1 Tax=Rubellicoccus peritrichatus TaxID=3080537 RepID=A0AAQ3L5X6_9BACT|nr:hypothetical protein [Puniceicoccus sp. CR14]WOO39656.1 hypothetical protein RZN69_13615 [Puniceicoccus sp. CR14]